MSTWRCNVLSYLNMTVRPHWEQTAAMVVATIVVGHSMQTAQETVASTADSEVESFQWLYGTLWTQRVKQVTTECSKG
jgi:hypothetical protein